MSKNTALQKIESHEKLCRIMQKQTHQKINKLEIQIDRIEKILLTCAGTLLVGMGGVITALVLNT
jgi:hypothetical protein|tara:strand:- start:154 stop:348 length:195 start_codon:yes stop_codon:yes gene_type:complete